MRTVAHLVGVLLFLVALIGAPAHLAATSVTFSAAPMMEMADGSPCPPKNCATMPDCTMALPGGGALFAIPTPDVSVVPLPEMSSDVFAMTDIAASALIHGDGLRRPPKI